jgi:hypothetical protein
VVARIPWGPSGRSAKSSWLALDFLALTAEARLRGITPRLKDLRALPRICLIDAVSWMFLACSGVPSACRIAPPGSPRRIAPGSVGIRTLQRGLGDSDEDVSDRSGAGG